MNSIDRVAHRPGKFCAVVRFYLDAFPGVRLQLSRRGLFVGLILALVLVAASRALIDLSDASGQQRQPESLSASEFSRLIRDLSEEGGYFRSDNFTSN